MKLSSITLKPASRYDNSIQFRYYFYSKSENTVCLVHFDGILDCLLYTYKLNDTNYHYNYLISKRKSNSNVIPDLIPGSKFQTMTAALYWLGVGE